MFSVNGTWGKQVADAPLHSPAKVRHFARRTASGKPAGRGGTARGVRPLSTQRTQPASTEMGTEIKPAKIMIATILENVLRLFVLFTVAQPSVWNMLQMP